MPRTIVAYEVESGVKVLFETDIAGNDEGFERAGIRDLITGSSRALRDALMPVVKTAECIFDGVKNYAEPPEEVTLEFGIKFSGGGTLIIASGDMEANCKLKIKWRIRGVS